MTRKVDKGRSPDYDRFDRKQKKHSNHKEKSSKRKLSIYDAFDEELDEKLKDWDFFEEEFE